MSSPYVVAAIGFSSVVALASIVAASNSVMNGALGAQQAIQIQTQKNQESLELTISDGLLTITNTGPNISILKEIRIYDENLLVSKTKFPVPGLELFPLEKSVHATSDFAVSDFSKTILGITDLGNTFAAENLDSNAGTGNGDAMINGMGLSSRIITFDYTGKENYGFGQAGIQTSLKPYLAVLPSTDFAAQLLSTDPVDVVSIPKLNAQYQYVSGMLQQTGATLPNILGYSAAKTLEGAPTVTQGSSGITISGTGKILLNLNDLAGQTLILEGSVPADSKLKLVSGPVYDYASLDYDSRGFLVSFSNLPPPIFVSNGCSNPYIVPWVPCMTGNAWIYRILYPPSAVKVSSAQNMTAVYNVFVSPNYIEHPAWTIYNTLLSGTYYSDSISLDQMMREVSTNGWSPSCPPFNDCYVSSAGLYGNGLYIYDRDFVAENQLKLSGTFQTSFAFSATSYLVAEPNGGTITISGSVSDPAAPYLKITNLPPNIPYEIIKDGKLSVAGMAQSDGVLSLMSNQMNIGGISPTGILHLYPNSLKHRGSFSTIVFDNANHNTIHIPTTDDKTYVVHAYVNIPVVGNVTVSDVYLDNALAIPYLQGNYTTGNNIKVPIIPGYFDINMKINGIPTTTVIASVLGGTPLKVIPASTSTITQNDDDGLIPSISATAGSVAYAISGISGTLTTSLTATISGNSEIVNYAYFGATPPPPPPPLLLDPLKAYVDVYKNGALVTQQQIFFSSSPTSQNSGGVGVSSSYVVDSYTYPQTVVNGVISISVVPGDFVEYFLYANIAANGSTPPTPPGHTLYGYSGEGHATVTIHSGTILIS